MLVKILGPVEDRDTSLLSLAYDDDTIDEIVGRLHDGGLINTRKRFGKHFKKIEDNPSFENHIMPAVFQELETSEALLGYQLPALRLENERKGLMELPWDVFVVRPDVNRELNIGHIIRNILRLWDIRYNDPIFARITTKDGSTINENNWREHLEKGNLVAVINDHQHGGAGRYIMGAPYALVDPIFCNKKSTDSEMYHKRNGNVLKATWEQQARNAIAVVRDKLAEGDTNIHEQDQLLYDWSKVNESLKIDFQSSSLPKDKAICNRGKDLYKYYSNRKWRPFYEDVILMTRRVWPEGEVSQEVLWGIFTFLSFYKENKGYTSAKIKELVKKLELTLDAYYPDSMYPKNYRNRSTTKPTNKDPNKRTLWGDANSFRAYLEEMNGDDWRVKLDKGLQMASALHHMIMSFNKSLVENGKTPIVKGKQLEPITSGSGNPIDFKNPYRVYNQKDVEAEYDWSNSDEIVDYSNHSIDLEEMDA